MPTNKKLIEFKLTTLSVKNATTVFVLTAIILISGFIAYLQMPRESFPEVDMPTIYIGVAYPGNSPLDIEKLITRPIEKELNTISGVDEIISNSIQGYSSIQVKFDFSVTPDKALQKVKDAVDKAKSDPSFPDDLPADPNIFEMNFSELMPVMNINLSGDFSLEMLEDYAEYLEDKIEQLPEITKVEIRGIQEKEVKVIADVDKMEAMNISFRDIENAIGQENMSISGGEILIDGIRRSINTKGEFDDWREIENIIVKRQRGNIVYLRDIATVKFEEKEKESFAREFTNPVVMLDIFKRSGENLIIASEKINKIIKEAQKNYLPENLTITITNDQSSRTKKQVSDLENSIIFGMLLVIAVLMFFLGLRNALFVGIAIPMSMFMSFMILGAMGITLNFMVLFALILALGMLVDNGIVIVENVYRLMSEGYTKKQAAIYGAGEVAWPIISSTATTLAAFLPLALWPGMIGKFMKFLPLTLIIVLSSSLFVALVINPVFTSIFMKLGVETPNKKKTVLISAGMILLSVLMHFGGVLTLGHLLGFAGILGLLNLFVFLPVTRFFQNKLLPWLEEVYERFLTFALSNKKPYAFLFGTFLLLIFSFFLVATFTPKVNFFPVNQPQYLNIFIEMPIGTDIEETNKFTQKIEDKLMRFFDEEIEWNGEKIKRGFIVESLIAQVGKGTSDPSRGPSMGNTPHKARIAVSFVPFEERKGMNTSDVMKQVNQLLSGIPGATITVAKNEMGPPTGKPISIEISGEDYDLLLQDAERLRKIIESSNIPGIEKLTFDIDENKPELIIEVDRQKARRLMLSTAQIGGEIRTALYGKEVSRYKEGEDDYKIIVRLDDSTRYNLEKLMNKKITFRNQMTGKLHQVPISAVAKPVKKSTLGTVKRIDLKRVVTLQSNVLEGYNANEIV
ncbi:MAG: efflux RND transporter permease subunit, partial [Bacteroidetes bacterium]